MGGVPNSSLAPLAQGPVDILVALRSKASVVRDSRRALLDEAADEIERLRMRLPTEPVVVQQAGEPTEIALKALQCAKMFIRNGVGLGFIRMPDADCPDPAHETPKVIDAAIAALLASRPQQPQAETPLTNEQLLEVFDTARDWRDSRPNILRGLYAVLALNTGARPPAETTLADGQIEAIPKRTRGYILAQCRALDQCADHAAADLLPGVMREISHRIFAALSNTGAHPPGAEPVAVLLRTTEAAPVLAQHIKESSDGQLSHDRRAGSEDALLQRDGTRATGEGPTGVGQAAVRVAEGNRAEEGVTSGGAAKAPSSHPPEAVSREDFDKLSADLTRAKNLFVRLHSRFPDARSQIEGSTGTWFVWGTDRDAASPPEAEPVYCGCGDQIVEDDGAMCGNCVMMKRPEASTATPLTEKQIDKIFDSFEDAPTMAYRYLVARAIEAALSNKGAQPEPHGGARALIAARGLLRGAQPSGREKERTLVASDLKPGGLYNFRNQPDRLIYIRQFNGWHQFKKIGDPRVVWAEVLDEDLHMIEETKP